MVTEEEGIDGEPVKMHHHIIINKIDREILEGLWKLGWADTRKLYPNRDYEQLAGYVTKSTKKYHQRRWTPSRNLKKPIVTPRIVKRSPALLKAPKGFIEKDKWTRVSDLTGEIKYLRAVKIGGYDCTSKTG
jgi:hypothetical protein